MSARVNRRGFLGAAAGGVAAGLAGPAVLRAAEGGGKTTRPNVLWFMFDDLRADGVGCYGQPWARTPHLDAVAKRGVRFSHAYVQGTICVPSRSSMTTGHYCHTLHTMYMGKPPVQKPTYLKPKKQPPLLLSAWTEAGITARNVGKCHVYHKAWTKHRDIRGAKPRDDAREDAARKAYPLVRLPDHGWVIGGTTNVPPEKTRPAAIADAAIDALKELAAGKEPFLLRVSFHVPHVPITVPPEFMIDPAAVKLPYPSRREVQFKPKFETRQLWRYSGTTRMTHEEVQIARGTYYGVTSLADAQIGRILATLESLGLRQNTIVAVNSDHGLQMGEHGMHKKRNFYEETVRIPFIFSWPGRLPEGATCDELVEMIDFYPTLMDLCGFEAPRGIKGMSLAPLARGETKAGRAAVFSEIDHSGSMYQELRENSGRRIMVRTKKWKMIYFRDSRVSDPHGALYDMENDPGETHNLYPTSGSNETVARLEKLVDEWDGTA